MSKHIGINKNDNEVFFITCNCCGYNGEQFSTDEYDSDDVEDKLKSMGWYCSPYNGYYEDSFHKCNSCMDNEMKNMYTRVNSLEEKINELKKKIEKMENK